MALSVERRAVRILSFLYCAEIGGALILAGIYKAPAWDWAHLRSKAGALLLLGTIGALVSACQLRRESRSAGSLRARAFTLGLGTNLITALLAFVLLETMVRVAAGHTPEGVTVGSVIIQPTWAELTTRSRDVIDRAAPWGSWSASYFVYDRELGWTVGSDRSTPDGLYYSSVEGVRSPTAGIRMADRNPRHRVALIGDSTAFSFEVAYDDSWGHHLERLLGNDVQVLNFGVDGHGLDQTYLRYQRDVRPWKPDVVVLDVIDHNFVRSMAVYPFVSFGWPGYLAKPRYAFEDGELRLLNTPLPTPNEILSARGVNELPFIGYDYGYGRSDWSWRLDRSPLLFRYLTSISPRWPIPDARVSDDAIETLNSHLLQELIRSIEIEGSVPVVVLVFVQDYMRELVRATFDRARVPFVDATHCAEQVPADRRMVPSGHHFTGAANEALARCTEPAVERALSELSRKNSHNSARHL